MLNTPQRWNQQNPEYGKLYRTNYLGKTGEKFLDEKKI